MQCAVRLQIPTSHSIRKRRHAPPLVFASAKCPSPTLSASSNNRSSQRRGNKNARHALTITMKATCTLFCCAKLGGGGGGGGGARRMVTVSATVDSCVSSALTPSLVFFFFFPFSFFSFFFFLTWRGKTRFESLSQTLVSSATLLHMDKFLATVILY